ncbi:hypothetical protein HY212_07060 [Candidatus Pacearchaeota archaeon]|nr:hypothetical protein [Candidatus Pacearchaeota archaeon]
MADKENINNTEKKDSKRQNVLDKDASSQSQDIVDNGNKSESKETKTESNKEKDVKKIERKKRKEEAFVSANNIPMSAKEAASICKFIKKKKIIKAINDLEDVLKFKKAVPMKGEVPHRRGNIMAGRYPVKAVKNFVILLKSLSSNAVFNELNEPIIVEAFANIGERPYGKFGSVRKKRANIFIKAAEKEKIEKNLAKGVKIR